MNSKAINTGLRVLFVVSLCAISACDTQTAHNEPATVEANTSRSEIPEGWAAFTDQSGGLSLYYPTDIITVTEDSAQLRLVHSVPHSYLSPCDFRDNVQRLTRLVDFDLTIAIIPMTVRESIRRYQFGFQETDYLDANGETLEPGLIDPVTIGSRKGYVIFQGAEGCGHNTYYLRADSTRTIRLRRKFITEFSADIITNAETYLALPGIITPDMEEHLFNQIAASIKRLN